MVKRASWRALGALWCHLSGFSRYSKNAKRILEHDESVFDRKAPQLSSGTCARPLSRTQNNGRALRNDPVTVADFTLRFGQYLAAT